jgi:CBS-domain-containing membrane protein
MEKETDPMKNAPRVRDFYTTHLVTVRCDTPIMRAVQVMLEHDISGMPVVDENRQLVGILTERDCIRKAVEAGYLDEPGGRVDEYMSSEVETVGPDDALPGGRARPPAGHHRPPRLSARHASQAAILATALKADSVFANRSTV